MRQSGLSLTILTSLSLLIAITKSTPIDNGLVGPPTVECGTNMIMFMINTEKPFAGRIFVKGMSKLPVCVNDHSETKATGSQGLQMVIPLGTCDMKRQRMLSPKGMQQTVTVVVSFHPVFITKVDRAFNIKCFYQDSEKLLTNSLEISMIPTSELFDTVTAPNCEYTVRRGSVNGPIIRYASIGDPLYHVWKCAAGGNFGILVRSCTVEDGDKQQFLAIDQNGCPVDSKIMGLLTYSADLNEAYVETHAFKFSEGVAVFFKCEVTLCNKQDQPGCAGITPPVCGAAAVRNAHVEHANISSSVIQRIFHTRSLSDHNSSISSSRNPELILDMVPSHDFIVLDPEASSSDTSKLNSDGLTQCPNGITDFPYVIAGFAILSVLVLIAFCICAALLILICHRRRLSNNTSSNCS